MNDIRPFKGRWGSLFCVALAFAASASAEPRLKSMEGDPYFPAELKKDDGEPKPEKRERKSAGETEPTMKEGERKTIKGENFGEKPSGRPLLFADFEKSLAPSKKGLKHDWDDNQSMEWAKEGPDGSGCAKASDGSGVWTLRVDHDYWTREGAKSYIFRRQRMNFTVTNLNQNWKLWRMWPSSKRYPNVYIGANGLIDVENIGGKGGFWGRPYVPMLDWASEEIFFQASSMNVKDGVVWFRANGVDINRGNVMTRSTKSSEYMSKNYVVHAVAANLGRWSPAWSQTNRVWVDEVYVDTSWSRLMLSDSPKLKEGRRWEIQIPVQWTDTAIEFEAHPGIFKPGETAYLYVFDSENRANEDGFPVRIGESRPSLVSAFKN